MDLIKSYDAQVAVLGSLLLEPDKLGGEIMHRVTPEDFGTATLRNLFRAARDIWLEGGALDPVTLVARAGSGYDTLVREVLIATPTAANWEAYAKILKDTAQMERLHRLAEQLLDADSLEDGRRLLAQAEDILTARPRRRSATYPELVAGYLDRQNDPTPPDYLDWGIKELNARVPISPGRFVVLGADSSVGKTALSLQLAYNMAGAGKRVGFFSYETSREDSADRLMANAADIALPRSKRKKLSEDDFRRAAEEGLRSDRVPLTVVETAGCTVEELRTEILAGRFEVVYIDYVQLIPAKNATDRWQVVTEVSMALHTLAQQLGVTIIALSQVTPPETNGKGNRRPLRKSDLRESRQLVNDADAILMMDLADPDNRAGPRVLLVDKNKDGPVGRIVLDFDPIHMRFSVVPPLEDSDSRKGRERAELMDRNRAERQARAERAAAIPGQSKFEELPDTGEELPF